MVNPSAGLVCNVEEGEVIRIGSDIAMDEFDLRRGTRGELSFKRIAFFVKQVAIEDVCPFGMEEADETCAYT